ncbi:MAG: tRNA lysidine(34) synthetase TilS, partial [Betaproteobacteria bacterium]
DDESNSNVDFKRNFLRVALLPVLAGAFPGYRSSLARVAAHAAGTAALLDELAARDAISAASGGRLAISALRALGAMRAGNLLRWMLAERGLRVPPSERLHEFLRQALTAARDRHPTLRVNQNFTLRAERGQVLLDQFQPAAPFEVAWHGAASVNLPHGVLSFAQVTGGGIRAASVGRDGLTIRTRQGGERLRIAAGRPSRTLKNLMQEAGIPAASRSNWPLLEQGRALVAVPGIGVGVDWQCPPHEAGWEPAWSPCATDGNEISD